MHEPAPYLKNREAIIKECQQELPITREGFNVVNIPDPSGLAAFRQEHPQSNLGVYGIPAVYRSDNDTIFIYEPYVNADEERTLRHEYAHAYSGDQMYLCWNPEGSQPQHGVFWAEAFAEYFGINKGKDIATFGNTHNVGDLDIPVEFIAFKKNGEPYYSTLPAYALHLIIQHTKVDWDLAKRVAGNVPGAQQEWEAAITAEFPELPEKIRGLFDQVRGMSKNYYIEGLRIVLEHISKRRQDKV